MKKFLSVLVIMLVAMASCNNQVKKEQYTFGAEVYCDSLGNPAEFVMDTTVITIDEKNGVMLFDGSVTDTLFIVMKVDSKSENDVFEEVVYLGEVSYVSNYLITARVRTLNSGKNHKVCDGIAVVKPNGEYVLFLENEEVVNNLFMDVDSAVLDSVHKTLKSDIKSFQNDTLENWIKL